MTGVSRSTWHYRTRPRPRVADPVPQAQRAYSSRIGTRDRERIAQHVRAGWSRGESVDHSFAAAWDGGLMLGSRRTWWRIAAEIEDQMLRPQAPGLLTCSQNSCGVSLRA